MSLDTPTLAPPEPPMPRMSRYWIVRDRVVASLESTLENQLVILRAPRGTGKSIAVRHLADALRQSGRSVHLVGGVARECGGVAAGLRSVLRLPETDRPGWQDAAADLAGRDDVLIIDDVELTGADESALIDFLVAAPGCTVVLTARRRTGLERTSVAVRVDTHLVDPRVLAFTDDETASLTERCALEVAAADILTLRRRLDGHAAAIHLAATALRLQGSLAPRQRDIEQAIEHALGEFTELCRDGLTATGVAEPALLFLPPYLTESGVATLCGIDADAAASVLDTLESAGLGEWSDFAAAARFRPLPLLRRALWRSTAEAPPIGASVDAFVLLLAAEGDPDAACEVAVAARRWPVLTELLEASFEELYERDPHRVGRFLRAMPAPLLESRPELATRSALIELDAESNRVRMNQLERLARSLPAAGSDALAPQVVRTLTVQTTARRRLGQFGRAAETADRMPDPVARLDAATSTEATAAAALALYESGLSLMHMRRVREARWRFADVRRRAPGSRIDDEAKSALAVLSLLQGEVGEAEHLLASLQHTESAHVAPVVRVARAFTAIERNDLPAAIADLDALEASAPHSEYWVLVLALRAWTKLFDGDPHAALALLRQGQAQESFAPISPLFGGFLQAVRSDALVAVRQAPSALAASRVPEFAGEATAASLTRALLQTGQDAQVTWLASQRLTKNAPPPRVQLELLLVRACACLHSGQDAEAASSLVQAEAVSREHGVRVPWRFIADDDRAHLREIAPPAVIDLLDADASGFRGTLALPRLSRRESMVLSRLRMGGSVAQIAKDLMVSSNTVKTQLRSVYRKLGVGNRSEAVRAALEWGLLHEPSSQVHQAR